MKTTPTPYEAITARLSYQESLLVSEIKRLEELRTEPVLTKIEVLYVESELRKAREKLKRFKSRVSEAGFFGLSKFPFCNKN